MNTKHNPFAAITDSPLRSKKREWFAKSPVPVVLCGWLCTTIAVWQFLPLSQSLTIAGALAVNMIVWSELRRG
jgi:hypothetical protein